MKDDIIELKRKFEEIKKLGYIKSTRKGTTGIGKTFEDLIGKNEDQDVSPDYKGIEIKTKRYNSDSYTNLFNCTPKGDSEFEIKRIVNIYGYPDKEIKEAKVFNVSLNTSKPEKVGKYNFNIYVHRNSKLIFLVIKDKKGNLVENNVHWYFSELKERLEKN